MGLLLNHSVSSLNPPWSNACDTKSAHSKEKSCQYPTAQFIAFDVIYAGKGVEVAVGVTGGIGVEVGTGVDVGIDKLLVVFEEHQLQKGGV